MQNRFKFISLGNDLLNKSYLFGICPDFRWLSSEKMEYFYNLWPVSLRCATRMRSKESAIFFIISWGLLRKCANFMGTRREKFWFHVDSSEKVNFMGFLKMAGFLRIHEIYDSHGENGLLLSWSKFQCSLAEKFSSYLTATMCKAHFGSFWTFYSHRWLWVPELALCIIAANRKMLGTCVLLWTCKVWSLKVMMCLGVILESRPVWWNLGLWTWLWSCGRLPCP